MRNLRYIVVEIGKCHNCGRDAGRHSIEGICNPHKVPLGHDRAQPETCYRGVHGFGFVDLDAPHDPGPEQVA